MSEMKYELLPEHIKESVRAYIEHGRPVDDFLTAVITNDLAESFMRADNINRYQLMDIVSFFYNYAPTASWGSPEKMEKWMEHHRSRREVGEGESK